MTLTTYRTMAAEPTTQLAAAGPEADEDDDYDNPRFSSAAQCIRFRMLLDERTSHENEIRGTTRQRRRSQGAPCVSPIRASSPSSFAFAPEFTHQVFPGEWIRGYQPLVARHELLSDPNSHEPPKPHRSFGNHILATHELRVDVALAPDCATCRVNIRIAPLEEEEVGGDSGDRTKNSGGDRTRSVPEGQAGSANASEWRRKRPRRHASMIADKRMKKQSQDDQESDGSGQSEGEPSADGEKSTVDAHKRCDEVTGSERKDSAPSTVNDDDDEDVPASEEEEEEEESDSFAGSSGEQDEGSDNDDYSSHAGVNENGITQSKRMTVAEIREALAKALPPMVAGSDSEGDDVAKCRGDRPPRRRSRRVVPSAASVSKVPERMTSFLSEPVGSVVGTPFTATRKGEGGGRPVTFVLALADGTDARVADYHDRVQRLATWFIETADEVSVAHDKDGGYWKIMYLFRRHGGGGNDSNNENDNENDRYSLVGYMTLYHFRSPFRKPKPGIVVRICQALVLPPYQRMGLGYRLLNSVYDTAEKDLPRSPSRKGGGMSNESIVEFNVEDPAPAFAALRNRVDYDRFGDVPWPSEPSAPMVTDEAYFSGLSDAQASEAAARLRITPGQVHVVHELAKLRALNEHLVAAAGKGPLVEEAGPDAASAVATATTAAAAAADDLQKRYRLMVKKRLNRHHREDLGGRTKPEAQRVLGELFDECLLQYQRLLLRRRRDE
jgi:GNAT superfamily N-acetyltransferase